MSAAPEDDDEEEEGEVVFNLLGECFDDDLLPPELDRLVVGEVELDEDFDFEEALRDIHTELTGLNEEAVQLAAQITENFEGLGI